MARKNANISLTSYDNIFSTEESRTDKKLEKVQNIPLNELHPFKNHPFRVVDDESMLRTVESVAQYVYLFRQSQDQEKKVDMNWYQDTEGIMLQSLQDLKQCL